MAETASDATVARPAFYARGGGPVGDWITLLHPPYTAWHLGYVGIGAALVPRLDWGVFWASLADNSPIPPEARISSLPDLARRARGEDGIDYDAVRRAIPGLQPLAAE